MTTFDYRRRLDREEVLKLAGAAMAAGAAVASVAFYFGRLWMQRVPLKPPGGVPAPPPDRAADPALQRLSSDVGFRSGSKR